MEYLPLSLIPSISLVRGSGGRQREAIGNTEGCVFYVPNID